MESIKEIKNIFEQAKTGELSGLIDIYKADERTGVLNLIKKAEKRIADQELEEKRLFQMSSYERKYSNLTFICGIDEVGRGPLAGPVVAGAVILPKDCKIIGINDSKKLSEQKREELNIEIREKALAVGIGICSWTLIDEINILQATYEAMRQAIKNLTVRPDILLNDAVTIPGIETLQIPIIKGDAKSISIAAASIVAKVERDHMMQEYDKLYSEYGFSQNKGYGSATHIAAIKEYGPCPIHRMSFIKNFLN